MKKQFPAYLDVFDASMYFIRRYSRSNLYPVNPKEISMLDFIEDFKQVFSLFLTKQGFNKKAIEELFNWGKMGHNWDKLHPTQAEASRTQKEKLAELLAELHYCSDRMSIDRMLRCHWLFNQFCLQHHIELEKALIAISRK